MTNSADLMSASDRRSCLRNRTGRLWRPHPKSSSPSSTVGSSVASSTTAATATTTSLTDPASPTPSAISVPLIAGAVGGSVAFLALIAVAVFVCRSRKRKAAPAANNQPDNYAQIQLGPKPNDEYNAGDISLTQGNYGNAQPVVYDAGAISVPQGNYDRVPNKKNDGYVDLALKRADDPSAKPGIRVLQTGVGTDYADGTAIASQ